MNSEQQRIIEVANELLAHDSTGGSTSEQIAAAFILNDMAYLPYGYRTITEAWDRLGHDWQQHVKAIQQSHSHLLHA